MRPSRPCHAASLLGGGCRWPSSSWTPACDCSATGPTRGGPYFSDANYTVLRAALLGASQAAVLLLPPRRQTRTTHGLQLAHEEFRRASNLRAYLRGHDGLPEGARTASVDEKYLESLRDPQERASAALDERKARRGLPDTDLVAVAAQLASPREGAGRPTAPVGSRDGVASRQWVGPRQLLVSMTAPVGTAPRATWPCSPATTTTSPTPPAASGSSRTRRGERGTDVDAAEPGSSGCRRAYGN